MRLRFPVGRSWHDAQEINELKQKIGDGSMPEADGKDQLRKLEEKVWGSDWAEQRQSASSYVASYLSHDTLHYSKAFLWMVWLMTPSLFTLLTAAAAD